MDRVGKMQYSLMGIGVLFFLWFFIPAIGKGIVNLGNITGMVVFAGVFLYGAFQSKINRVVITMWQKTSGKVVLVLALAIAVIIFLTVVAETYLMVRAAVNKPEENTTAIVLGCSVKGTKPSRILAERLEAAYQYLSENPQAYGILSGGRGSGEDISEAQCMFEYLTEKGIEEERLILEDQSTSTEENIAFSKKIIMERKLGTSVAIVTSEFHQYRASQFAKEAQLESFSISSHTSVLYLPTYYVRELYGILFQKITSVF